MNEDMHTTHTTDRQWDSTSTATADTRRTPPPQPEGVKDTIESIIVALILAFVFRAFVVEAFVIPTGSMAPTLYGAHGTIVCEDCGTEFAYGLRDLDDHRMGRRITAGAGVVCPNCHHVNSNLAINDEKRNAEKGDRILVLKWPFDVGIAALGPQRWDVVVFKDPADGVTNFIKRLVGKPNEVLTILDGDVYTAPLETLSPQALASLETQRHAKYERQAGHVHTSLPPLPNATLNELDTKLRVVRKTAEAQLVLWFPVYDNDRPSRRRERDQPRWVAHLAADSGWDTRKRTLAFQDRGQPHDHIRLLGREINAANAYNVREPLNPPPVGDDRVRFVWAPKDQGAVVRIRLEKLGRFFWASISAGGEVELSSGGAEPDLPRAPIASTQLPPFPSGVPVKLAFENLDYRLAIRVGDQEVLASSSDPDSPAYYGPNVRALRIMMLKEASPHGRRRMRPVDTPRIYGAGGAFTVAHLRVDRDIYYYHQDLRRGLDQAPWAPASGWGSADYPIMLRSDEFFMLGDNTVASKDSRLWDVVGPHLVERGEAFQLGTVPRDQLIGKAFFVYWPAGHALGWLPLPVIKNLGIIPDVGRMRWIR